MTSDMSEIKDGDFVEISYHYKSLWVVLGEKGQYHTSVKSVKHDTIEWARAEYKHSLEMMSKLGGHTKAVLEEHKDAHKEALIDILNERREQVFKSKSHIDKEPVSGKGHKAFAEAVCILQYEFGVNVDKDNGVWFNIMRTHEQLAKLASIKDEEARKRKEKRQRQKANKQAEKQVEASKKWIVRIKSPQAGRVCYQGRQVVVAWTKDINDTTEEVVGWVEKKSFYEELGWFEM